MGDSMTYRGKPPWTQGRFSDNELDRLVKAGVVDVQAPYRPDPMDPVTAGISDGQFLGQTYEAIKAQNLAQTVESLAGGTYQHQSWGMGDPVDMGKANSSKPYDEDTQRGNGVTGPIFPGGK